MRIRAGAYSLVKWSDLRHGRECSNVDVECAHRW